MSLYSNNCKTSHLLNKGQASFRIGRLCFPEGKVTVIEKSHFAR